jgi:uncharacterized protein YegP (UPF0339 family)
MKLFNIRLLFLCGFLLFAHPCEPLAASEGAPEIKDIIVTTSDIDLLLFATVKNGFTQEMLDGLKSGIPIVFNYQMELVKTNSNWMNTTLAESSVTHTMTYDPGKQEYKVAFSYQNGRVIATPDLEQAKQLMAELNGIKVIALAQLVPDAPYAIHFKVTLKEGALPLGMHRLLPFLSLWNFETDWRTIEFRY